MKHKILVILTVMVALVVMLFLSVVGCAPSASSQGTFDQGSLTTGTRPFLSVTQPQDNTIIAVNTVQVKGQTEVGAVVSVQGDVVNVDSQGNFSAIVSLSEGPNVIEVLTSDQVGNQAQVNIVVNYVKGG